MGSGTLGSGGSSKCRLEELLETVTTVTNMDLETLARSFTVEERLEFYNEVSRAYKMFLRKCFVRIPREDARFFQGLFELAKLKLAASFKENNEDVPEVTRGFREEEYEMLRDFEELKVIDFLSVDDIVEFIERKEGKVYEVVKKYYERQYYLLDTEWSKLKGPLALALAESYKERRRKIEEAVLKYVSKKPLTLFIGEIEEAVIKTLEAKKEARRAKETLGELERIEDEAEARLSVLLEKLEEAIARRSMEEVESNSNIVAEEQERILERLESLMGQLEDARRRLEEKELELKSLSTRYSEKEKAYQILQAEAENLRNHMRNLEEKLSEYKRLVERLRGEKEALQARVEELVKAVRGEVKGHLVMREEAWAMEEALVNRVMRLVGEEATIYDPRRRESRRIKWSKKLYYSLSPDSKPKGRGVMLVAEKGVFRKNWDVVVEAVTYVHPENYARNGFDSEPMTLSDLLGLIEDKAADAGQRGYYHLLIVSSPTGFTEKVKQYIGSRSFYLSFVSANMTVYLVDPVSGEVLYNRDDPAAEANRVIAEPRLPEEKLNAVIDYVLSDEAIDKAYLNSSTSPFLTVDEIVKATGEDPLVVRRALQMLEDRGKGRVVAVQGEAAFIYNI